MENTKSFLKGVFLVLIIGVVLGGLTGIVTKEVIGYADAKEKFADVGQGRLAMAFMTCAWVALIGLILSVLMKNSLRVVSILLICIFMTMVIHFYFFGPNCLASLLGAAMGMPISGVLSCVLFSEQKKKEGENTP